MYELYRERKDDKYSAAKIVAAAKRLPLIMKKIVPTRAERPTLNRFPRKIDLFDFPSRDPTSTCPANIPVRKEHTAHAVSS